MQYYWQSSSLKSQYSQSACFLLQRSGFDIFQNYLKDRDLHNPNFYQKFTRPQNSICSLSSIILTHFCFLSQHGGGRGLPISQNISYSWTPNPNNKLKLSQNHPQFVVERGGWTTEKPHNQVAISWVGQFWSRYAVAVRGTESHIAFCMIYSFGHR